MPQPTAVLFLTHVWNEILRFKFERLRREIGERADVRVMMQRSPEADAALAAYPPSKRAVGFVPSRVVELLGCATFEDDKLVPGSTHFPLMAFAHANPGYANFLVVEFDVEFTGNWGDLLDAILVSGAEFASMHLRTRPDVPDWYYWGTFEPSEADAEWAADLANHRRAFNPIFFINRRALDLVYAAHKAGWRAHYECLVPTIVAHHGCAMLDLAEGGHFCLGTDQDWAPDQTEDALSTVRWRPPIRRIEFLERSTGHTLFHPIKGNWYYDGTRLIAGAPRAKQ